MYEIKDSQGNVIYTATTSDTALSYYYTLRNKAGYAEAWYNGKCFFKTK